MVIHSVVMGVVAGMRAMTPLAALALTGCLRRKRAENGVPLIRLSPLALKALIAIASGELLGDKMKSAPDRIVLAGC